ncbi:MAG: cbb3-type cytochrome c oxidase subunit I, partial [Salinigranum sp.]
IWWTFGHPEVYIMVIPGMGISLEIIARFSERPLFGYKPVIAALALVSAMSAGVWAHHMYATGIAASRYVFMVFSLGIAVAFAIFIFAAVATMYKGRVHLTTPMIFAIGSIIGLIYSGMEGIDLGQPAADIQLHSTYFVVGHFHFTLFMVGVMGLMAGIYYWYPKMAGRMYNSWAAKYHAFATLLGLPMLFFLMGHLGELGMMRRYATYTYAPGLQQWHIMTTLAAYFVGSGQLVFFLNMILSLRYGAEVEENPWDDLFSGQHMPSPEWDGFPYAPPTPSNVYGEGSRGEIGVPSDDGVTADGGVQTDGGASGDDARTDGGSPDDDVGTDGGTPSDGVRTAGGTSSDGVDTDGRGTAPDAADGSRGDAS